MACYECDRLLAECGRLKRTHATALHARIVSMSAPPEPEYVRLKKTAAEAWIDAECAVLDLSQHQRSHELAD